MAEAVKMVAKNSKAYHDYFIEEKYEAGIELAGTEVKSIRQGHVNLKDSFCHIKDGQMWVIGLLTVQTSFFALITLFRLYRLRPARPRMRFAASSQC